MSSPSFTVPWTFQQIVDHFFIGVRRIISEEGAEFRWSFGGRFGTSYTAGGAVATGGNWFPFGLRQEPTTSGDEFEIALRARNLLDLIDSLYFGGCTVRLVPGKNRIAWNQPVGLTVVIHNASGYPARVPLAL